MAITEKKFDGQANTWLITVRCNKGECDKLKQITLLPEFSGNADQEEIEAAVLDVLGCCPHVWLCTDHLWEMFRDDFGGGPRNGTVH